ncbi:MULTISPECIES: alpha/beta fold hydrolase [Streptomyces]|uniref:Alpha/beta fold hydrolase n=1 Tax=Streptomyces ardesiacus TaxID=285564 RepID=A0ABW8HGM3_9ACTN|nr:MULTISPECIES: alpha/beta hydrolase [Streptomyces]NEB59493.1 alpha/beta hydrolase [Streptomyces diastaticus]KOU01086.1 esterase [Streptomyces sp. NRRL F-4711]KOX34011.1 esterase [Streptomyces sp. NRRL F-4707]KOX50090.1 esterase [Streptomyces sp. NRRL F-7442]MCL7368506.1 alpha/beta hydrolase [Streptomyces ardesiacus]
MTTFFLVHGAWHSGQSWERVVPLLEAAGHRVLAPSLTGYGDKVDLAGPEVGLDTHVDDVVGLITEEDLDDVVLVGHSYAGLVISSAANRIPERVAHLVYLDAMVPEDGESAVDVQPVTRRLIELAEQSGSGWRVPPLPEQPAPVGLFGVTDPADVAWLRSMLSDQPVRCLQQPVRLDNPAVNAIPRTHIHNVGAGPAGIIRRPVPPVQPNGDAAQVWELPTGHDCMITMPVELSELLLKLA